jgi:predicted amidohydrolase
VRVTVLELPATWGHPARVLEGVERAIGTGPATDVVVLPEQSLSGYLSRHGELDLAPFAEDIDGPTARRCVAIAKSHGVHLFAPLVLRESDALYNAMVCYRPEGVYFIYRKRHPWIPEEWATAGAKPLPIAEIAGKKVTVAVCYDVHFLAEESAAELRHADVLMFPSAWVEQPDNRAKHLSAIAKDFDLDVVNANWGPGEVVVPGQGNSVVIGRDGALIARAPLLGRIDVEL